MIDTFGGNPPNPQSPYHPINLIRPIPFSTLINLNFAPSPFSSNKRQIAFSKVHGSKTNYVMGNLIMRAVRFELTHLSILELKSSALDHSAKLAGIEKVFICINNNNLTSL